VLADAILAAAAGALARLVVRSFDWRGLHHVQASRPDIELVWLTSATTTREAALWWDGAAGASPAQAIVAQGGRNWAPEHIDLTRETIEDAHRLGLRVLPWTVNDAADMARLIAWGVDGLCTDRPDIALSLG
jgi:glycerophosphoryl diester phosphodiesterase